MSAELLARARRLMPGGVNSPVRAFGSVGGDPPFIARGSGPYLFDRDGRRYVDLVGSWGPLILGHADPGVVAAVERAARDGLSFGATTEAEVHLAEQIAAAVPSIQMVRFTTSGTEAAMSVLRLARAATGRARIVKFAGCYHGHADAMLAEAGSGIAQRSATGRHGEPGSPGVPPAVVADTTVLPYNHADAAGTIRALGEEVAAVVVEPIAANMGLVPADAGWLESLRAACTATGALLIFDEVVTGFRVARGGAQQMLGITPDLTILGKVIGGGMPVGAYGGPASLMRRVAPEGPVYQAGTLAGNPVAMAAGLATLARLDDEAYRALDRLGADLEAGLMHAAKTADAAVQIARVGSMIGLAFTERPVRDLAGARAHDPARFAAFFHRMLARGVWWPPSPMETAFVSLAHGSQHIAAVAEAAAAAFEEIA